MELAVPILPADDFAVAKRFSCDEWRVRTVVKRPPRNEEWGARTFDLINPFGKKIFVLGPLAS